MEGSRGVEGGSAWMMTWRCGPMGEEKVVRRAHLIGQVLVMGGDVEEYTVVILPTFRAASALRRVQAANCAPDDHFTHNFSISRILFHVI